MLDRETVERLLQNNLDAKLNSELSKYGYQLDAAHKLFRFITSIFERTPPELITWKFKVIMPVGDWDFSQKIILNFHRMNEVFTSECAFIIVDSNLYLIEPYEADYSGRDHICYQYNAPQNESLTIKDKQFQLSEYYDSAITSIFAQPTYKELDEAMDYYNTRYVRDSSCAVLSLPHCQVMNSRKRQPQRKIFVAAVLIGGLKQKNPRLYQGNKNFSIA